MNNIMILNIVLFCAVVSFLGYLFATRQAAIQKNNTCIDSPFVGCSSNNMRFSGLSGISPVTNNNHRARSSNDDNSLYAASIAMMAASSYDGGSCDSGSSCDTGGCDAGSCDCGCGDCGGII